MQITIVVGDKTVICDGVGVVLPAVDWSVFDGDPTTRWDDIAAVQFNTDSGQGHIEYRTIVTDHPARPNIRPGDMPISADDFQQRFAWILDPYKVEASKQRAAAEAVRAKSEAARQQAEADRETSRRAEIDAATSDMREKLAALEAQTAQHRAVFEKLNEVLPGGDQ